MTDSEIRLQLKSMIVEALMLEDVTASDIEDEAPLFGEGLGLDSIDALELAIEISRRFGVKMEAEDEETQKSFASVATLAAFVSSHQAV